jgi:chromosome segregation protein
MRIKQIELNGFKSFMERTVLDLPPGVTAVVGPNGCGKSNIVDAIRWVLGEQSPKHLRGSAMEDVIFAGNAQQGPLGMAEASLLLERSEEDFLRDATDEAEQLAQEVGGLPPELARASEVLVTRRYFRSGDSEYFINRAPCRLRDITELFLGTGVGTKAYAIIEQGRVEQLVNAKPEELRSFIEEAAGTTRYRSRKVSAERKMARTKENLLRVQDVLHEQQRQMASLERQAKRAEEYHRLKGELRDLDLRITAAQRRSVAASLEAAHASLAELRGSEAGLHAELQRVHETTSEGRALRAATETRLRGAEAALTEARVAAADAEARASTLAARRSELLRQIEADGLEAAGLSDRAEHLQREFTDAERGQAELAAEESDAERRRREADEAVEAARQSVEHLARRLEEVKDAVAAALNEETRLRNMDQVLRRRREELEGQQQQLEEAQRMLGQQLEANSRAREALRAQLAGMAEEQRELDARQARLREDRRTTAAMVERNSADTETAQAEFTQLESRAASLHELQERAEGCARGTASLLARESLAGRLLADVLRVPAELERAVAVALRGRLGDVVVESTADALAAVRWLVESGGGTATVVPRDPERRSTAIVPSGTRLVDAIDVEPTHWALMEALLGEVLLASDLDEALETWRGAARPVTIVTRSGEALDPLGGVTGGSEPPLEETLLTRSREIRDLERDLGRARMVLDQRRSSLHATQERLLGIDAAVETCERERQALELGKLAAEKDRDRLDDERARLAAELEVGALEASGLAGADGQLAGDLAALDDSRLQAEAGLVDRRRELATCQEELSEARRSQEAAETGRTQVAVRRAAVSERRRAGADLALRTREALEELSRRRELLETRRDEARVALATAERDETRAYADKSRAVAAIELAESERAGFSEALTSTNTALESEDARERSAREEIDDLRARRAQLEVAATEGRLELQHLAERLRERYDLGLEALDEITDAGPPSDDELGRAEHVRSRLVRLGDVNPAALEELEEIRGRHEFLLAQRRDLEQSMADLENTITTLNRTCRQRFLETFEAANTKLAHVFPKLFPGGTAQLRRVLPPEEGGEAGVEIVVQPAGKKLQTLTLLSGGEKALTATALVFSLFLIRPTPFCLLDEVDAPLDEANIGRFNQMVREMAETSQFVLVTHNRRTMEVADTLYGITMEQAGVSKVVSVRLHEAA